MNGSATEVWCQGHRIARPQSEPKPNPWPGDPNTYECPWGCNGTGDLPWFSHIADGVCFGCHGQGWIRGRGDRTYRSQPPQPRAINEPRPRWRRRGNQIVAI